jgi:hypothetical protein
MNLRKKTRVKNTVFCTEIVVDNTTQELKTLKHNKGNNKITEHRAIFQRKRQNSEVNKQTKSVNNRKTGKTAMALS